MTQAIKSRQEFQNYFRSKGYKYLPPSKVYNNDPTLMFVNSGMCQLKDIFLGTNNAIVDNTGKPTLLKDSGIPNINKSPKLMNSQICIRAGGKHNDLDDVGKDSYHLTLFEMGGFWQLDNANKTESIQLALEYLIDICHLNPAQMYFTYFEGNDNIPEDTETKNILEKFTGKQPIKGSFKDNFWMMGDTGPCGVSTEIHYDIIGNRDASNFVNKDDPTVIEIWNLVFMEFVKDASGFKKSDKMYTDTGLGNSRLNMIMQNKKSIYLTDEFKYLFGYAQALTGADFYEDSYGENKKNIAYRIFVDHIRTCIVSLHQGIDFDCNKRGSVLRKIFRRMLTYTYLYLNNFTITNLMSSPIVKCIISSVLNYFLEFTHDVNMIHNKMIAEEKLYLGKLTHVSRKYHNLSKKNDSDTVINKMKTEFGIDNEIISNLDKIVVK